jgi:hypothetical protein
MECSFFIRNGNGKGPFINLDFIFCFLLIIIEVLPLKEMPEPSLLGIEYIDRINHERTTSPFTLYLYLKPLYSNLGGSTTREDPFTNRPGLEHPLLKPLYRWKTFIQHMFVLSDI